MDSFEDWLKSSPESIPGIVAKWATKLLELGASWDTFQGDNDAILDDLVDGGIPRLSARDIFRAMNEVLRRRRRPLIVLWDIENVSIPSQTSASLSVSRIKAAVAPYGQIKQFRAYADIAMGHIPEEKRSELHLSGCNLVDSTHNGRKEVADKMIIVDSMEFAYTHLEGAVLCFITGDVDYAYLLSKLQKPQLTTIVISKGSNSTMLHANCDVKLRWETDVLQLPLSQLLAEHHNLASDASTHLERRNDLNKSVPIPPSLPLDQSDKKLLYSIITEGSGVGDGFPGTRKSFVGSMLKERQPERFADRNVVKAFLAQTIDTGVVFESGEGAFKSLHTPGAPANTQTLSKEGKRPNAKLPLGNEVIPQKVFEVSKTLPYMVLIEKWLIPKGTDLGGIFVQQASEYLILMFKTFAEAQHMIESELQFKGKLMTRSELLVSKSLPTSASERMGRLVWSNNCISVTEENNIVDLIAAHGEISLSNLKAIYRESFGADIQSTKSLQDYIATSGKIRLKRRLNGTNDVVACLFSPVSGSTSVEAVKCATCNLLTPTAELFFGDEDVVCCKCFVTSSVGWSVDEQETAKEKVVAMLKMMARCDDILAPRNRVKKALLDKYPSDCASRGQANLWIDHSVQVGAIYETKHCENKKNKVLVLPEFKKYAEVPYPVGIDTSDAESFVTNLLWEQKGGVMDREVVNNALKQKFASMAHPIVRGLAIRNGVSNSAFFVAKGAHGQTIGLIYEDAKTVLETRRAELSSNAVREEGSLSDGKQGKIYSKGTLLAFRDTEYCRSRPDDLSNMSLSRYPWNNWSL